MPVAAVGFRQLFANFTSPPLPHINFTEVFSSAFIIKRLQGSKETQNVTKGLEKVGQILQVEKWFLN